MEQWARNISTLSQGKLTVTIYPGGALGKPGQQYDSAVNGITDIAFGLHAYTAGRFPLTSVMQLPFLTKSAVQGSAISWDLFEQYASNKSHDIAEP